MVETITSPNVDNYVVGKGICYYQKEGGPWVDLGDVSEVEYTPEIEELEHFTSREGIRRADKTVTLEQGGTLRWIMGEWTPHNIALMVSGNVVTAGEMHTIEIMEEASIVGKFMFRGKNAVGPQWIAFFDRIEITPQNALNLISEEWGDLEIEGNVVAGNRSAMGSIFAANNPVANDTVTIGATTYTFKVGVLAAANDVLIGPDAAGSFANLAAATNAGAGAGIIYHVDTEANEDASSFPGYGTALPGASLDVVAIDEGALGNAVPLAVVGAGLSVSDDTLGGGIDGGKFGFMRTNIDT